MTYRVGLVGLGHIACEAHIPSLEANPDFRLAAVVSRRSNHPDVATCRTLDELLVEGPPIDAVSLCGPPQVRYSQAQTALAAGKHVFLEKPPGATLSEVADLEQTACRAGATLFASWHSRQAAGVASAREWLADKRIRDVTIQWHEDVRVYHPGQQWIWEPGGLGVFDPGINALSIATFILPKPFFLTASELLVPENCGAPIAAKLDFSDRDGTAYHADFDWRRDDEPRWRIDIETSTDRLCLDAGGNTLWIDGQLQELDTAATEYDGLYAHFATLIADGQSDVDSSPMRHVADAFLNAAHIEAEAFHEI